MRKTLDPSIDPLNPESEEPEAKALIREFRKSLKTSLDQFSIEQVRWMVDYYYQIQDYRIQADGQIWASTKSGEIVPEGMNVLGNQMHSVESSIKLFLGQYSERFVCGQWAKSICGIGPVISSGLIAHLFPLIGPMGTTTGKDGLPRGMNTAGKVWVFAGLSPDREWKKGELRPWNAKLKVLCYKAGESFVKVQNRPDDFYGKLYRQRKGYEAAKNEAGDYREKALELMKKFSRTTEAYKSYSAGKLPPGHLHARARRWAVKIFLAHFHEVAYCEKTGQRPPKPYVLDILGHADEIGVPNWPF